MKNKESIKIRVETDEQASQLKRLLIKAGEPIYHLSNLKDGMISASDDAIFAQFYGQDWNYAQKGILSKKEVQIEELANILGVKDFFDYTEKTTAPQLTITREALSEVYPLVCPKWREIISNELSAIRNKFLNEIVVSDYFLSTAYEEWPSSNQSAEVKEWLDKYLPKPKVEVEKTVSFWTRVNIWTGSRFGEYANKATAEDHCGKDYRVVELKGSYKVFE